MYVKWGFFYYKQYYIATKTFAVVHLVYCLIFEDSSMSPVFSWLTRYKVYILQVLESGGRTIVNMELTCIDEAPLIEY